MANIFAKMRETYRPTYLKSEPFVHCCGANFVAYFPEGNDRDYESLKPIIKRELNYTMKNCANSMMLLILNHKQAKHFDGVIKEVGFRTLMRDVYHSGHGNNLTLYGWEKYEKREPTSN